MTLKAQLQKLIENSPTLNSLPAEELKLRADAMLSADESAMAEFIKILENETVQMKKVDEDFVNKTNELNDLIAEANQLEHEAETILRKEKEEDERSSEEKKAESLLKQLDQIK